MIDFKTESVSEGIVVVKISGELNESTQRYFFDCVSDYLREVGTKHLIIECAQLGFINSAGMTAMLRARKSLSKRGSKIYFTQLNSSITKALELTKLSALLAIYPKTKELVSMLQKNLVPAC